MVSVHWVGIAVLFFICECLGDTRIRRKREVEVPFPDGVTWHHESTESGGSTIAEQLSETEGATTTTSAAHHTTVDVWQEWFSWSEWNTWREWYTWDIWNTWDEWRQWDEWNTLRERLDLRHWERWNSWATWNEWNDRERWRSDNESSSSSSLSVGRTVGVCIGVLIASLTLIVPVVVICRSRSKQIRRRRAARQMNTSDDTNNATPGAESTRTNHSSGLNQQYLHQDGGVSYVVTHSPDAISSIPSPGRNDDYEPTRANRSSGLNHQYRHQGEGSYLGNRPVGYIPSPDRSALNPGYHDTPEDDHHAEVVANPPPYDEAIDSEVYLRPDPQAHRSTNEYTRTRPSAPDVAEPREQLPEYEAYMRPSAPDVTEHREQLPEYDAYMQSERSFTDSPQVQHQLNNPDNRTIEEANVRTEDTSYSRPIRLTDDVDREHNMEAVFV